MSASQQTAEFDFYGFARLEVVAPRRYLDYFHDEYAPIDRLSAESGRKTSSDGLRIRVEVRSKLPQRLPGDLVREIHYKNLFHLKYAIRGLSSREVTIFFEDHWSDRLYIKAVAPYLQCQLFEPVLYAKLFAEDVYLIHAGGVTKDGRGFVLPARGGTGKTTLSLGLVRRGYSLLGDDLIIVDLKEMKTYAYPRPLHLFRYNLGTLEGATITPKLKAKIYGKDVIRIGLNAWTRRNFLISTRVPIEDLYAEMRYADPADLAGCVVLKKEGQDEVLRTSGENLDRLRAEVIDTNDLRHSFFDSIVDEDVGLSRAFADEEKAMVDRLLAAFSEVPIVNTRARTGEEQLEHFDGLLADHAERIREARARAS